MPGITVARLTALAAGLTATANAAKATDEAVQGLGATVRTVGAAMGATLTQTAATATKVGQAVADAAGDWKQSQLDMLDKLRQMVIPFEGTDAGSQFSFDKIIEDQIAKVKAGSETISDAIQELQRQFGSVYGTLQQRFFGSQDPSEREFLQDMEQFINSGRLNGQG